ncbi:MAG: hypothetical protein D6674_06150 [Acidobacteria bacterium]|nr:MAG: hypothetical protein D6674_06150 [Acidobacteriota bacterium]
MLLENPCGIELARKESKRMVATQIWATENPEKLIALGFSSVLTFFSVEASKEVEARLEEEISIYEQSLELTEVSKPKRIEEGIYSCSAVFSYNQNRYVSTYTVKEVHSGMREKLYNVEVKDVYKVER